jgi:hypothetical protein
MSTKNFVEPRIARITVQPRIFTDHADHVLGQIRTSCGRSLPRSDPPPLESASIREIRG